MFCILVILSCRLTDICVLEQTGTCEPITVPLCQDVGYNYTSFPNFMNHKRQEDAGLEVHQFHPLVKSGCSDALKPFLCSMYVPKCTPEQPVTQSPCKELCQLARSGCEPLMNRFGFNWPESLDCEILPEKAADASKCYDGMQWIFHQYDVILHIYFA